MTTRFIERATLYRDGLIAAGLLVAHEAMKRFLAGGGLVAALLSPGGAHSAFTLLLALLLVLVRFALIVVVPAFVLGRAFELWVAAASQVRSVRRAFLRCFGRMRTPCD